MRSTGPTVGAPIRSSPVKRKHHRRQQEADDEGHAPSQIIAGLGGRRPPTMPLIPAMRPQNAISRTAETPISAPPMRASKYGCMIVSFSTGEQAFLFGLGRPRKNDVAIGFDQGLFLARIFEAVEEIKIS